MQKESGIAEHRLLTFRSMLSTRHVYDRRGIFIGIQLSSSKPMGLSTHTQVETQEWE
jgi:hypothetical protein